MPLEIKVDGKTVKTLPPKKKHRDPASAFDEGRFLSGDKDLPKPKVKKPHASCKTPEACVAQNRCRKTGKKLVNGKVAK